MMDAAMDMAYRIIDAMFGAESTVPWWAWCAPLVMIFAKLLGPVVAPETAGGSGGSGKKGKKAKKGKK
jgi:hypothetical protein